MNVRFDSFPQPVVYNCHNVCPRTNNVFWDTFYDNPCLTIFIFMRTISNYFSYPYDI